MIRLVEHFYSIQGEGRYIGKPSLFFRLGGCNLRCEGYGSTTKLPDATVAKGCDTLYAVDRSFSKSWMDISKVEELIAIYKSYNLPQGVDIVFTGGEPLLYASSEVLVEFLRFLQKRGHRITFETNATLMVDFSRFSIYKECLFVLAIKLENSNEPYAKRIKPKVVSHLAKGAKESFFKFTLDEATIKKDAHRQIEEIRSLAKELEVFCMPLGDDSATLQANTAALIPFCKQHGYRFSDRLHIRLWGQTRGV